MLSLFVQVLLVIFSTFTYHGWAAALRLKRTVAPLQSIAQDTLDTPCLCSFKAFRDGSTFEEHVTAQNAEFQSGDVLVIRNQDARILVFARKEGNKAHCHEQAAVQCLATSSQIEELQVPEGEKPACQSDQKCIVSDSPTLGYIRSMIGGALHFHRGKVTRVASIGLGAGSIPLWLNRHLPSVNLEAVDINQDVLAAASCFGIEQSPTLQLVEADGRAYLSKQPDRSFDVIFIDAFTDQDVIPPCLKTVEFFRLVHAKLALRGVLVMNSWSREINTLQKAIIVAFGDNTVLVGKSPGLKNLVVLAQVPDTSAGENTFDVSDPTGDTAQGIPSEAALWAEQAAFSKRADHQGEALWDELACPEAVT